MPLFKEVVAVLFFAGQLNEVQETVIELVGLEFRRVFVFEFQAVGLAPDVHGDDAVVGYKLIHHLSAKLVPLLVFRVEQVQIFGDPFFHKLLEIFLHVSLVELLVFFFDRIRFNVQFSLRV